MAKQRNIEAKITADNKQFKRGMSEAQNQTQGFGKSINSLKTKLGLLAGAAAIGAVVKGFMNMAKQVSENADRLLDLEQITGASTDRLQEFEHVSRIAGVNSEFFSNAVMGLTQRLARGAEMSATLVQGVNALGLETHDAAGNLRNMGEVTEEAILKLADMEDVSKRNVIGAQLFSGAWKDLAPVLALGKDGIEAAKREARELGLVMSNESLQAANEYRIEMETLSARTTALKNDFMMGLMPALTEMVKLLHSAWTGTKNLAAAFGEFMTQAMGGGHYAGRSAIFDQAAEQARAIEVTIRALSTQQERESALNDILREKSELIQAISNRRIEDGKISRSLTEDEKKQIDELQGLRTELLANYESTIQGIERVAEEAHAEEVERLGDIERINQQIATAQEAFTKAETDRERIRHQLRISNLEAEKEKLIEIANQGAVDQFLSGRGMTGLTPMQSMESPLISVPGLPSLADQDPALLDHIDTLGQVGDAYEALKSIVEDSAYSMGASLMQMAQDGKSSTAEIIKQALAATMAQMMKWAATQIPFPMSIAAMAAAGAAGQAAFGGLPSYASGTSFHPGGPAIINERGGEIVNLPTGSQVIPHDISKDMAGSGGEVRFEIAGDVLLGFMQKQMNNRRNNV